MPNLDQMMMNAEMVLNEDDFEDAFFVQIDDDLDDDDLETEIDEADESVMLQMPNLAKMTTIAERHAADAKNDYDADVFEEGGSNPAATEPEELEEASAILQLPCHIRPRLHEDVGDELASLTQLPHLTDTSRQPQFMEQFAKKRHAVEAAAAKCGMGVEVEDGEDLESEALGQPAPSLCRGDDANFGFLPA